MNHRGLLLAARILIPIVFVGLGLERLLIAGGLIAGPPFWTYAAAERHGQLLHFLKSFATLGGLLALIWADLGAAKPGGGARA